MRVWEVVIARFAFGASWSLTVVLHRRNKIESFEEDISDIMKQEAVEKVCAPWTTLGGGAVLCSV